MNYKMNFGQSIDQEIPTKVYNLLLAGLASSYRMTEFANMYEDMKSQGSADASSHYIAFESYMSVKDAMRAYQVCGTIIDSSQPSSLSSASSTATSSRSTTMLKPSVESLLDLFELIVVSKMYDACSKVLGWIRRVSALESVEERRRVGQLIQVRVEPLVGSMQKDIRGSLSSSSSDVSDASIGDSSDEADGRWRAIEDKKRNALLLFEEFVAHDISLPDSVYIAVMKYFHSTHNMVGIAKTWAALDKRAKKGHHQQQQQQGVGNPNQQSQPPTPHQIKARLPSEECVQVFLAASRDLCGARSGKSVLKLVRMEHLSLNKESYLSLLALSARHGWIDEIIQLFIEMSTRNPDSSTGNNHSTSYLTPEVFGHVDSMLANNKHRRKRKQLTEFMEESFPEVVGLWFENVDSDLNKQLESIRNLRL